MADTSRTALDPRLTPARADLAARHLAGKVASARFVDGQLYEIGEAQVPVRRAPSPEASIETEALHGERVSIYELDEEGWAWGQLEEDGYVGFLPASALRMPGGPMTHQVSALRALVFPGPSVRLPPIQSVPLGGRLAVARIEEPFAITASGGYVPARHLVSVQTAETDFVAVAERFLGAPYLWGGKTNLGVDCSGLVQVALAACGIACPRDSDMQEKMLGESIPLASSMLKQLQRGDLLFWSGHVAIVRDQTSLIHANAYHMVVAIETICEAVKRIGAAGGKITSARRLSLPSGPAWPAAT
jgi:cell wall-associated NlpC family hydrolase